jgi:levanase/fructan beta-fructosidase
MLCTTLFAGEISMKITRKYLNFPVSHKQERAKMTFEVAGAPDLSVALRLASGEADYWVFKDASDWKGKTVKISYAGDDKGLGNIYQDDAIAGQDSLYKEKNRPQFHFTTRRGWINDPNGLLYYDGEYHLFYQHNPYERDWENMHWGHAVSKDLIHWEELNDALFPDNLGTMFSGSAVIDYGNTAGYNQGETPAMIAAYTAACPDKQTQCIAYSLDKGRSFTKYAGNPVIDSKHIWNSQDTRDPKVFRYQPGRHWVMALNERDGHSIYTSSNLKEWKYESHVTGYWECPELFELPVDGNPDNTKWVMYGASGTYMIGTFDGKIFTPESGKYLYTRGSIYAAQTFTDMPDKRRVQIGWGRIGHPGMSFNGMMLLPTELTLHTTKDGVRLFSQPVREAEQLFTSAGSWRELSAAQANEILKEFGHAGCLRLRTTLKLSHATSAGLDLFAQRIVDYDLNSNLINGAFYSPEDMTSMKITADIYIDRTSIEIFIDNGIYSYSMERKPDKNNHEGFHFWGNNMEVENLEIYFVKSIW